MTWTNLDFSLLGLCDIHLRSIWQEVLKILIHKMSLKNKLVKLLPHLLGANALNHSTKTHTPLVTGGLPVQPEPRMLSLCLVFQDDLWFAVTPAASDLLVEGVYPVDGPAELCVCSHLYRWSQSDPDGIILEAILEGLSQGGLALEDPIQPDNGGEMLRNSVTIPKWGSKFNPLHIKLFQRRTNRVLQYVGFLNTDELMQIDDIYPHDKQRAAYPAVDTMGGGY